MKKNTNFHRFTKSLMTKFFAMNIKPKIDLQVVTTFTTNIRNRNSGQGCLLSHACYCTDNKNRAKKVFTEPQFFSSVIIYLEI